MRLFAPSGTQRVYVILVGRTAGNDTEYAAIAVPAGVPIRLVGRISFSGDGGLLAESHVPAANGFPSPPWADTMPHGASLDYRSIVYVIVDVPTTIAVGFLHNTYTLPTRDSVMQKIPAAMRRMTQDNGVPTGYLGGDFNVKPLNRADTVGTVFAYSQGLATDDRFRWTTTATGQAASVAFKLWAAADGTTTAGNLYDHWYSTIDPSGAPSPLMVGGVSTPLAGTSSAVLDRHSNGPGLMSDHAATFLRVL
jgi:hypothetical protein